MSKENLSRLTIDIPKKHHIKLKSIALITEKSMREIIIDAIESIDLKCLNNKHLPNKETLKSIDNIKKGKNLTEIDDLKTLFYKLNQINVDKANSSKSKNKARKIIGIK